MFFCEPTHVSFPRSELHARSTINSTPFRLCTPALLLVVTLLDVSYAAEQRTSPPPIAVAEVSPLAPVTLDGQVLFKVRGVSAFPAEQRAGLIEERLRDLASNENLSLDSLRVEEGTDRSLVKFSDELVVIVFEADAEIEGVSRQLLAEVYRNRIRAGVEAYRHDRNPPILYTHALYAVGATAALSLSVYLVVLAFRRVDRLLEKRYKTTVEGLHLKTFRILESEQIWSGIRASNRLLRTLLIIFLLFIYRQFVLGLFPWTKTLSSRLLWLTLDPLQTMGLAVIEAVPNLTFLLILAIIIRYALKLQEMYFRCISPAFSTVRSRSAGLIPTGQCRHSACCDW